MGSVTLSPAAAADSVCHEEQLVIWAGDLVGRLSIEDYFRDLSYDEGLELTACVKDEIKRIVSAAFNHPEVRAIKGAGIRPRPTEGAALPAPPLQGDE